jgi:hypothetical protein
MRQLIVLGLILFGFAAVSVTADAHGPTRQKLNQSIEIDAPPEKIWEAISNFQDMSWHPAVESVEGTGGNDEGATRTLTLKGGGIIKESLHKYEPEEMSYSYRIDEVDVSVLPVTNYSSTIAVLPGDDGVPVVEWRGAFYRGFPNNDPPPELNEEAAIKAVTEVYQAGLESLKAKLEAGQ